MEAGSLQHPQPRTAAPGTITPSVSGRQAAVQELQGLSIGQCPAMLARKPRHHSPGGGTLSPPPEQWEGYSFHPLSGCGAAPAC